MQNNKERGSSMTDGDYSFRDRKHVWHPYTKRSAVDAGTIPVIVRGDGVYLHDVTGRRYFDAVSSWWSCNLGHGHPRLVRAIRDQLDQLQHSILGNLTHPGAVELAERLAGLLPGGDYHVLFASDGASSVEAALKIAVQYHRNIKLTGRVQFASLENAYHGDTLGAVTVGYLDCFHRPFASLLPHAHRAQSPCCSMCSDNPATCRLQCFDSMARILENNADTLAAVIVEPLCQCAGGMRIYSPKYLRKLSEECEKLKILLIVDEIAVGFGRTGKMFAFEHAGIKPDIVCMGKGLSGGYLPISATVVRDAVYDTFSDKPDDRTFYHGHTFSGNPVAAAAAIETLNVYGDEGITANADQLGKLLAVEMKQLADKRMVKDVRCLGMIGAVEFEDDGGIELAQTVKARLMEQGILVRPLGNVVYLMPPLVTPPDVLTNAVRKLADAW
ncbi:MAG: adenosylmethionine--8-amino-7-oxononanoate transaminase [Lentisphaerae bacterium]|nr:adenosylmethionine--8-amino-7-oxononanoate transaminase [Lentisphaerota bacterium]